MCLTKPSYDICEHWFYLNKVNEKWIQQLQELLFDRKELFEEDQCYLEMMDVLKDFYKELSTKTLMKEKGFTKTKVIEKLKQGGGMKYMKQAMEELEDMNETLKNFKYNIYLQTTTGAEQVKWANEWGKEFPELAKKVGFYNDDHDDDAVDVEQEIIDGKIYYVGCDGEYKDVVFDTKEMERIGKLVDGKIILD